MRHATFAGSLFVFSCLLASPVLGSTPLFASGLQPPPRTAPQQGDSGEERYAYIVGLLDRGLYDLAITEAQQFLKAEPNHARATLTRYRLATTLFDLDRRAEAAPLFAALLERAGFEYRTEAQFRLAQCQLDLGQLDAARTALLAVLQSDAAYLLEPARFMLGEVEFRAKRDAQAQTLWLAFLDDFPQSEYAAAAHRGLAWCAWHAGDPALTIQRASAYLKQHGQAPDSDEVRILLGEAQLESGNNRDALQAFQSVQSPAFAAAGMRGRGFALAALGEHAQAAAAFARVVEQWPTSPLAAEADLQRGVELLRSGDAAAARQALKKTATPPTPDALFWLASAESALQDWPAALAHVEQALQLNPTPNLRSQLQVARGDALTQLGRTSDAQKAYEAAGSDWALHAAAVAAWNASLTETHSSNASKEAERLARELLKTYPNSPYRDKTLLVLGEVLFTRGDYPAALQVFDQVTGPEAADLSRAASRRAWCLYLSGDPQAAALAFAKLTEAHPASPEAEEARYMLARALRDAGDEKGAAQATATYLKRHPQGRWVDVLLLAQGLADPSAGGTQALTRLVNEQAESALAPQAQFELAERAWAAGDLAAARAAYQALLQSAPAHALVPRARYGLAWCAYSENGFDQASAELRALLTPDPNSKAPAPSTATQLSAWELLTWSEANADRPAEAAQAWTQLAGLQAEPQLLFDTGLAVSTAYQRTGDLPAARAQLQALLPALQAPDLIARTHLEASFLAAMAGDLTQAEAALAKARTAPNVDTAEASFFLGEAHVQAGHPERALAHFEFAARGASPLAAKALYKLGFVQLEAQRYPAAETALARLVDEFPKSDLRGEALFLLGEARYQQNAFDKATAPLETVLREFPKHAVVPKAQFRLGLAYGQLARYEACEQTLAQLAKSTPDFANLAEAELWRGRALSARNQARAARQAFGRTLALDAGASVLSADARIGLGKLSQAEGEPEAALSEFLKVAVLFADPDAVAEALCLAGACLETLGDPVNAAKRYDEVLADYPTTAFADTARAALRRLRQ